MTQNHPLEVLEVSSRVAKRAQYEAFSFSLVDGAVQVRNESHADPAAHEYLVRVESGVPVRCTCPADDRFDGACKHRVAVAIRRPIVDAAMRASARQAGAVPDGGSVTSDREPSATEGDDSSEACADCLESFPCWECYRMGRRTLGHE